MNVLPRHRVYLKPAAERALKKVADQTARRPIARVVDGLAATPRPDGAVTIHGSGGLRRIRAGDYRVVYTLEHATRTVLVVTIGLRREVYRR
ncbi:MAG: type II toxin-antitoxin system RelE/ParE family toxin [Gammaproteobacteria bacterium]|nr:type II toxin-antitoxin system RelE/ParE family toxin [Gammaproteobacteria bacterium]MDE0247616.1 type II toxin-antitoxin system RelE/ParE family toxin [Gammaproteobacteria bacterium]